eukprot:CAMPEP_0198588584 /NCGR_PEP_ID=MMETSP1462-20131121/133321_1 /TAXON_ID=1333877 /ORGANISM="Brandtodinium nutriculum, Strain RCC3387" /LENGTH=59 /DNA_ID=CAMNT_0044320089 /DNA_START=134 /DNA_END=310 /DNA_ORIENTATION=+
MKNTKANFAPGKAFIKSSSASSSESETAPDITRNKVNILAGTVLKGAITCSGTSCPGPN